MDITACRYKGISLNWNSAVGASHPAYYEAGGLGWLRTFQGGMLVTCGLDQFGSPCVAAGESRKYRLELEAFELLEKQS